MWGILGSWIWVVGTIVQFNHGIKPSDTPQLWSVGGMAGASLGPLLLVGAGQIALMAGVHRVAARRV